LRGPICPDTLAEAGILGAKVMGLVDADDLETTVAYEVRDEVTRKRKITDQHGKVHEIEVTVYDWNSIVLINSITKIPLAINVIPMHKH